MKLRLGWCCCFLPFLVPCVFPLCFRNPQRVDKGGWMGETHHACMVQVGSNVDKSKLKLGQLRLSCPPSPAQTRLWVGNWLTLSLPYRVNFALSAMHALPIEPRNVNVQQQQMGGRRCCIVIDEVSLQLLRIGNDALWITRFSKNQRISFAWRNCAKRKNLQRAFVGTTRSTRLFKQSLYH